MRRMMASNSQNLSVEAAIGPAVRDRSPDTTMGRSGCFTGFLCLGFRKRGKRIVPSTRMHGGNNSSSRPWGQIGAPQAGVSNQYASLSPSLLAPPSSPASFQNSGVQSSAQSPAAFPIALSVPSTARQIPMETSPTMFQMGPYAHETALVSPPVFSTFTTAPSTAPFTPPPELASHLTTPSSPDVPFAQLLASSFGPKGSTRLPSAPTLSVSSPFASPDIIAADDLQATYQLYPGSPLAHLLSPTSGTGEPTPFADLEISSHFSPFPNRENSVQASVSTMFFPGSPLISPDPSASMELDAGSLLSQALTSCSFQEFRQEEQPFSTTMSSLVKCEDDSSGHKLVEDVDCEFGPHAVDEMNRRSGGWQEFKLATGALDSDNLGEENFDEVREDFRDKRGWERGWFLSDDLAVVQHQPAKRDPSDQTGRNLSQMNVICNLGCAQTVRKFSIEINDSMAQPAEATVKNEIHSLEFKSNLVDPSIGDIVAWGTFLGEKMPMILSTPQSSLMEMDRMECGRDSSSSIKDSASLSGTSAMTNLSNGADCISFDHMSVAAAEGYLHTTSPQELNSSCKQCEAELNCKEHKQGDHRGKCGELGNGFGKLMQDVIQPSCIEVQDRIAIYREQQVNSPEEWILGGTKFLQRDVSFVSSDHRHGKYLL